MIREIEGSVRKNLLLKPVFYTFSSNKIGKEPCNKRDCTLHIVSMFKFVEESLLISLSVRFDLSSFYSRFTSKHSYLYFHLTAHLASCREIGNFDIKVVQKQLVDP